MKVVHKNVLVEIPDVEKERNGVLLPEEEQVVTRQGVVVRFGEAVPDGVKALLESNPTVKYKEYYEGEEITIDKKNYIVMTYESILIIL
jgi:co-chaperonin GroES (HSP10)